MSEPDAPPATEVEVPATEAKTESEVQSETNDVKPETANGHSKSDNNYKSKGKYDNDRRNNKRGSKFDPSVLPKSKDALEICNQVEFYFGDSNLPTDAFLWDLTDGSSNKPVPIKTVHAFKRMKRFEPYSAVVEALKGSAVLKVEGEEGAETVARKTPYDPATMKSSSRLRSVYAKGFGEEQPSTQFDIEAFFAPHGPVNAVRLRRNDEKEFKGSVFVEFADEETAQKFLDLDPKPQWRGEDLQILSKKDYEELRIQEIKDGKREPNSTRGPKRGKFNGPRRGGRGGDRDPDDWKKRRDDDQKSGFRDDRKGRFGRGGRGRGGDRDRRPRDNDRKRSREEDGGNDEPAPKKADVKEDVAASS